MTKYCTIYIWGFISIISIIVAVIILSLSKIGEHDNKMNLVIQINSGKIRGSYLRSFKGNEFIGFRGIRYGKDPSGALRFQAPVPVEPWTDIFNATEVGPMCPQPYQNDSAISEDCLRLNVYTKHLPNLGIKHLKPVVIYIHGGSYYLGSGISTHSAGPQYLMESGEIVLVAINYRLGALGFLSLGIQEVPGNAGFKDQVLALKWVKENIAYFGGDPNSVTLLGNSAGASSILLHLVSPMSKGLFHKAILMSTAGFNKKIPTEKAYLGIKQAKLLNCKNTEALLDVYDCLKKADVKAITNSVNSLFEFGLENPIELWGVVVERDFGQERFIIENPQIASLKRNYSQIPIIAGIVKNELATSAVNIITNENYLREFDENYETVFPICFMYESDTTRSKEISNNIWNSYNLTHPLTKDFLPNINMIYSDIIVGHSVKRVVEIAERSTNVYYYQFSFQGRYSNLYYPDDKPYGVEHSDDLIYLFGQHFTPTFNSNDPEYKMVEKMTRLWTQFIETGDPNNPYDEVIRNIIWPLYKKDTAFYLDINSQTTVSHHLNENRYKICDQLFPLPGLNNN